MPFEFEGLHMIPALFDKGEYAFNVDHVSGYFHVKLTEGSRTYFGFEWEGVYDVYNVLNKLRVEAGAVHIYVVLR
eukprot:865219-Pyramimonas_sp.AAC.1